MLPTFQSWTVRKMIECLTQGLLSSHWNVYHSTTAYFFWATLYTISAGILCHNLVADCRKFVNVCHVHLYTVSQEKILDFGLFWCTEFSLLKLLTSQDLYKCDHMCYKISITYRLAAFTKNQQWSLLSQH